MERTQTSLYLDADVKKLVDANNVNLTKWVNDSLRVYFSVGNIDECMKELDRHTAAIEILNEKLAAMRKAFNAAVTPDWKGSASLELLQNHYRTYCKTVPGRRPGLAWIKAPAKVELCNDLHKKPELVLKDLEVWYNGL